MLMMYVLFCLVMRTAYQGKQFEFLTKEMRQPDVQIIDEMVQQNFILHVVQTNYESLQDMGIAERWNHILLTIKSNGFVQKKYLPILFEIQSRLNSLYLFVNIYNHLYIFFVIVLLNFDL